jgi:hypothetical protein
MRKHGKDWAEEYDARLTDPGVHKDKTRGGMLRGILGITSGTKEVRVADDTGTMRRRNGEGCCGCGRWTNHHGEEVDTGHPVVNDSKVHSHHDDKGDDESKLFWGLF